jgi:hypothetical protein
VAQDAEPPPVTMPIRPLTIRTSFFQPWLLVTFMFTKSSKGTRTVPRTPLATILCEGSRRVQLCFLIYDDYFMSES